MRVLCFLFLPLFAALFTAPAWAEKPTYHRNVPIKIENPYTLTAPKWLSARPVYMQIINTSMVDDVLVGAESPFAKEVILQYTHDYGFGIRTMRPLENQVLNIPAQSIVHLKPAGLHLMLHDLNRPLELGMEAPIKLKFKNSPDLYIKAIIHQQPNEPIEFKTP